MRYPRLLRKRDLTTPATIHLYTETVDEYGQPVDYEREITVMCNYQDSAKAVLTDKARVIKVTGVMLIDGDICPDLAVLSSGTVEIHGVRRDISSGTKARNPDGTVNYTRIELM